MENYYSILNISPSAEPEVIKAAFRVLSKKYHPDVDSSEASKVRMQAINLAYDTLSNKAKRKAYDDELASRGCFDFTQENEGQCTSFEFESDWLLATEYYPEIEAVLKRLNKFSYDLGMTFKVYLLECKSFNEANSIASKMEDKFLRTYFGTNNHVQALARQVIVENRNEIAVELNQAVRVLGDSQGSLILRKVKEKYPDYFNTDKESRNETSDLIAVLLIIFLIFIVIVSFN
ncbi:J domain-containing protein [Pseudoalteromonas sp. Angola-7]|uniref:J domain-containing protein n=1 Tax=Pseudoalteromonas sp. Angola-7 TaxID=3025336 RepID=UPI0023589357|nr:J domain-containing protein [Pseudoalteromonas sp. Angola-7]MDC9531834.1 J domain-containing protein [Pseudoalteromonas sp. Angola-7]